MKRTIEEKLLNPKLGSKAAAAKEFGIDLTLLVENLRLTPEQRINNLQSLAQNIKMILESLIENNVKFVVVGEFALYAYGWKTITSNLEICFSPTDENTKKLFKALTPFDPRLRGSIEKSSFVWSEQILQNGTNLTFKTGDIDLMTEVVGVGDYETVEAKSILIEVCGLFPKVISIDDLITSKRATGRMRDLLILPELENLRESLPKN